MCKVIAISREGSFSLHGGNWKCIHWGCRESYRFGTALDLAHQLFGIRLYFHLGSAKEKPCAK